MAQDVKAAPYAYADSVETLVEAGFALHWLRPKSKAPVEKLWTSVPRYSAAELRKTYRDGYNRGVRLGEPSAIGDEYLYVIDLDIRKSELAEEAYAALREFLPNYETLPTVASGSGGLSRHFYLLSAGKFASKKLAHSVESFFDDDGRKHWAWEVELFGTGKQVAMPPSIHPDTGLPYRWERKFDLDLLDMGLGPSVPAAVISEWAPVRNASPVGDSDLIGLVRSQPTDLTPDEVRRVLDDLPLADWCEDRDGWLQVGMGLHHQFEGSDQGFRIWCNFSKQSEKYVEKDQRRVWDSFTGKPNGVRFPTLIKAAADARLRNRLLGEEDNAAQGSYDPEDDDLIGPVPASVDLDAPSVDWIALLDRTGEGNLKSTLPNAELIVKHDPRIAGTAALNQFTQEVVQRGEPGRKTMRKASPKGTRQLSGPIWQVRDPINGDLWSDAKDNSVRSLIEAPERQGGYGIRLTDRDLKAAINLNSSDNAFHPIREYLSGLKWDRTERAERLYIDYLGADNTPYHRSVAKMFLVAAVTRIFEPGHKFDYAVILEGLQGKKKSTFIKTLARGWFAELDGDFHDTKTMVECMQGAWILEIPELSGFGRSDVRQIKAFISRATDKVRLAYERRAVMFPRQCVFQGSTNDREYLRDDTGGRRFWPVECIVGMIDVSKLEQNIDQIWAEAYAIYLAMRKAQPRGELPLYLSDDEARLQAEDIQESRRVETADDALAGQISAWLDLPVLDYNGFDEAAEPVQRTETCLIEIWTDMLNRDRASYGRTPALELGSAMKKVRGWISEGRPQRTKRFGPQRIYRKDGLMVANIRIAK